LLDSLRGLSFDDFAYLSHGLKAIPAEGVLIGDDMHRRFLSRRGAAVDPDIVGAVIGCGICRVNAEGDHVFVPVEKSEWGHTTAVPAK